MQNFKKTVLKNGIRVLSELHPSSRAVSIGIWVLTGTRDESSSEAGISHFLEHLVFKGTKNRSAYQISKALEVLGGELNAYTTREYTCYHALVLKDHWREALDVLTDLVSNMNLSKKEFNLEKGVILQEIAMSDESHEEIIYDLFFAQAYGDHPLAKPILGSPGSIAKMTQQKVMDYYKRTYSGKNIIISSAGCIDHHELVEEISKALATKKKTQPKSVRKAPRFKHKRHVVEKQAEQVHMLMGFPTASFRDSFRFEAYALNTLLGGGMTSRLYQSVREKKGLVYSIYSALHTHEDSGLIHIYAGTEEKNLKNVGEIIFKELKKLKNKGVTKQEVEMSKTQVIGSILLGSDDIENRMTSIGVNEMVFGKYRPIDSVIEEIKKVSVDSVNEYIEKRFHIDNVSGVLLGPNVNKYQDWFKNLGE